MKCQKCWEKAIFLQPKLCQKHFLVYFENKVKKTIKRFGLIKNKKQKIKVACSGGKDSTTLLYLLNKFGYRVTALAIDEGIKGYRDKNLKHLKEFCSLNKIRLEVYSFKKEFGLTLDEMIKKIKKKKSRLNPCYLCGILRRYLLNKYSKESDLIATGHNLDDESQTFLMNLLKGNTDLLVSLGPKTGVFHQEFTQRIKPLYLCPEKEVFLYSLIRKTFPQFVECPYSAESFRREIRDFLNKYSEEHPQTKENIIRNFLLIMPKIRKTNIKEEKLNKCLYCSEPSRKKVCKKCQIMKILN